MEELAFFGSMQSSQEEPRNLTRVQALKGVNFGDFHAAYDEQCLEGPNGKQNLPQKRNELNQDLGRQDIKHALWIEAKPQHKSGAIE